ncbi:MAG: type II toxin-antitoxin system HicB family antitoxin [Eubacterium sp.]|jgi:predicted RNase H-like HicB family nuclease|nr:type II toxin-antitoxin system HicB family antitoxin [Eubacterium sp.]
MLSAYPAIFYKEHEGNYSVIFPDLNHLATCGNTLEEALSMAVDCLAGYIYTAKKDGESLPHPSEMKNIDVNSEYDDYAEVFVNIITIDADEYAKIHFEKSIRKNVTIPAWLNDAAMREKINFSQVLQTALKEQLNLN